MKVKSLIAAFFVPLLLCVSVFAQSLIPGVVIKNANLRAGPGTNYAIVGTAKAGQAVNIAEKNAAGTWYHLEGGQWIADFLVKIPADSSAVSSPQNTIQPTTSVVQSPQDTELTRIYVTGVQNALLSYAQASTSLGDLLTEAGNNKAVMATERWQSDIINALANLKISGESIKELNPPSAFADIHKDLLAAIPHIDSMVNLFAQGLEQGDKRKLVAAVSEYKLTTQLFDDAADKVIAFKSIEQPSKSSQIAAPTVATLTPTSISAPLPTATPQPTVAPQPTANPNSGQRYGAICRDGTHSNATAQGACSHHGGVDHWLVYP